MRTLSLYLGQYGCSNTETVFMISKVVYKNPSSLGFESPSSESFSSVQNSLTLKSWLPKNTIYSTALNAFMKSYFSKYEVAIPTCSLTWAIKISLGFSGRCMVCPSFLITFLEAILNKRFMYESIKNLLWVWSKLSSIKSISWWRGPCDKKYSLTESIPYLSMI